MRYLKRSVNKILAQDRYSRDSLFYAGYKQIITFEIRLFGKDRKGSHALLLVRLRLRNKLKLLICYGSFRGRGAFYLTYNANTFF